MPKKLVYVLVTWDVLRSGKEVRNNGITFFMVKCHETNTETAAL
jgi:hypothetical protein